MTTIELPQNIEAEEQLIGDVLMDGDIFGLVNVDPEDFYIHRHRFIWQAMKALHQRGMAIDPITIVDELDKNKHLAEIGGAAKITELISNTVSYNYASHAAIVKDKATRRKQIEIARGLADNALNGGVNVADVIDALTDSGSWEKTGRHISTGISELYDTVAERSKDPKDVWGIPTGFIDLDKLTGGMHRQQTMMVSGSPGAGKTTIMLQIALNAAKAGNGVAIFEAEMDEQRCLRRLIEIYTAGKVTNRMMVTGRMTEEAWNKFIATSEAIRNLPLWINDDPGIDTGKIRTEVARLRARRHIDLVCMDYVNLLKDKAGDGRSQNENIATKARRFREVCRALNVAGLTIQSMNKEGMKSSIPQLADMSGPTEVHYGADTVLFLVQDEKEDNLYRLLPAKQRDGDQGRGSVQITRRGLSFYNLAKDHLS